MQFVILSPLVQDFWSNFSLFLNVPKNPDKLQSAQPTIKKKIKSPEMQDSFISCTCATQNYEICDMGNITKLNT